MSAKKFFIENTRLISPQTDPKSWNLNSGLLAMAKEIEQLTSDLRRVQQELHQVSHRVQHLR